MQETNLNPESNPNLQPEEPRKKNNQITIIVLIILLIGSISFNIYQSMNKSAAIELINVDLRDERKAKEKLQEQLNILTAEFETSKKDLMIKDSTLSKRDVEIFEKQKEIQNLLNKKELSESELKKAKRMINSLNGEIARFKDEIKLLRAQNDSLVIANTTIVAEKEDITNQLIEEKEKSIEKDKNIRSTFSVSNYKLTGLKVRKSGKEVETDRARRIDKLRVTFDLDPNNYAETGAKEIYIAIYKPDGQLGKFKNASPGEIDTWSLGKVQYSDKVKFHYNKGTKQNITFDWEEYDFPKGTYKIDLYQNGFKIGQKTLDLR